MRIKHIPQTLAGAWLVCAGLTVAEVDLTQFVDVQTETFTDVENGFQLEYPWEWFPRENSATAFSIAGGYSIPSLTVHVKSEASASEPTEAWIKSLWSQRQQTVFEDALVYKTEIEFKGIDAIEVKCRVFDHRGDMLPGQLVYIGFTVDNRSFVLETFDRYHEDGSGQQVQDMLESFELIEASAAATTEGTR